MAAPLFIRFSRYASLAEIIAAWQPETGYPLATLKLLVIEVVLRCEARPRAGCCGECIYTRGARGNPVKPPFRLLTELYAVDGGYWVEKCQYRPMMRVFSGGDDAILAEQRSGPGELATLAAVLELAPPSWLDEWREHSSAVVLSFDRAVTDDPARQEQVARPSSRARADDEVLKAWRDSELSRECKPNELLNYLEGTPNLLFWKLEKSARYACIKRVRWRL